MKNGKKLLWLGAITIMLITTSATCEGGGKKCDCPKFSQIGPNNNDAVASQAAANTLD
ncbi:MAG TPA: hypothetical protein PK511_02640 [Chitinophagales bacterium]|nr:hypothetical protein [Chitinophagales bacterium]HMX04054.1 hypothetical protein [Chitinophagales bacterium]HMZ89222.1 hypothetical protein [Chitinophagales bacterium]HNA57908.1 hypothetical protein [Chitinophagales bacterium]HNE45128.1 hypothetical protein [Chitinophagales bacterium]